MKRAAVATLLCCSAAGQEVSLGASQLSSVPANAAVGTPWSDNGEVHLVPSWLDHAFVDYFRVPSFDTDSLVLTPENNGQAPSRGASSLACGRGWAKNEGGDNTCFTDIFGKKSNNWGWSNLISAGDTFQEIPIYIGASHCSGGKTRAWISASYDGTTVTVNLEAMPGASLRSAAVYVGKEPLPKTAQGDYSSAPGGFPVKRNVNDDPVVTFSDLDGGDYYFAVHANICEGEGDGEATPPAECPSNFYIAQYQCGHGPCTAGVDGGLAPLLVGDGWDAVKGYGVCFTLPETGSYVHETRVFAKEVSEEYTTPQSSGFTSYIGVFATGCGETVTPPPTAPKPGPVRLLCKDNCPPGSDGYTGSSGAGDGGQ